MDNKRLNHEIVPEIKQGHIDAWERGKDDSRRNKILKEIRALTPSRAVKFVKMYAELGDIHFITMKFDISLDEGRRVLTAFNINSIEDAKKIVGTGIIAELDNAENEARMNDELDDKKDHAEVQKRLEKFDLERVVSIKSPEESDQNTRDLCDEAQRKNKQDRLRQLIAEGIDPNTNTSGLRIPLSQITRFKQMIPHGVNYLRRQFGGTSKDIVNEVKRLAPYIDVDVLRP